MSRMSEERRPTIGEEIANSLSHGAGLAFAIVGTPFLIVAAMRRAFSRSLFVYGLGGGNCGAPDFATCSVDRSRVVARGRHSLHCRRRLLCRASNPVRTFRLASVCYRGNRLSFLRRSLVLGLK